jgi:transposase-like protein
MLTVADVALRVMGGEHGDLLRDAIVLVCREVMEAEITARVGAEHGERGAERAAYRNGYRPRAWERRFGELELLISRARSGPAYFPGRDAVTMRACG